MDTNAQNGGASAPAEIAGLEEHLEGLSPEMQARLRSQVERQTREVAATEAAAAEPFPGPLAQAFAGDRLRHAGVELRPLVASDIVFLKQLNSPLYLRLKEMTKPAEARLPVNFTDEEGWEMIYQFTIPVPQVRALLAKGRPAFSQAAAEAIGDKLQPKDVNLLAELVVFNLAAGFGTIISYDKAKPAGEEDFFTKPPAPQKTDSAGGSATSADPSAPLKAA